MPRKGANLSKTEIWSLLTNIDDELAAVAADVAETKKAVAGFTAHRADIDEWQAGNMRVLSSKVPRELARRVDEILADYLPTQTRSSLIAHLLNNFCDNIK